MKNLLIVEDDPYLLNAYRVKFVKAGFEVKTAMDGNEAIVALQTFTPDVILLDLIMPKKDGFSTLEEIKKNEQWKDIPIVISSNLGQKEDIDRGRQLGAIDFVVKSELNLNTLVDKVNKLMNISAP